MDKRHSSSFWPALSPDSEKELNLKEGLDSLIHEGVAGWLYLQWAEETADRLASLPGSLTSEPIGKALKERIRRALLEAPDRYVRFRDLG